MGGVAENEIPMLTTPVENIAGAEDVAGNGREIPMFGTPARSIAEVVRSKEGRRAPSESDGEGVG